jgi:hypothetical protein
MFLRLNPTLALLLALLAGGCTTPNPAYKPAVDGLPRLDPQLGFDGALPLDGGTPAPAPAADLDDTPTPPPPPPTSPPPAGLGTLCTTGSQQGICLRKCTNLNKPCDVPDTNYSSGCVTYWNSDVGKVQVCAIFCELNYKTYPCPNATDYKCKPYGAGLGACIPK